MTEAEADAYFATRPRDSRIGAWASRQSRPLESRFALEKAVATFAAKHVVGEVPRPPFWSGFLIVPRSIEFWHDRPFRLHDRILFTRPSEGAPWRTRAALPMMNADAVVTGNANRRTLILTGASRGIGHETVKRFSSAGWRVISCSRHAFPKDCPWEMGPEDHIQVDLADLGQVEAAIARR